MIKWSITHMDALPRVGEYENVVISVWWKCEGFEIINGVKYGGVQRGEAKLIVDHAQGFTPYEELRQDQVFGWFLTDEQRNLIESNVILQVTSKSNMIVTRLGVPWAETQDSPEILFNTGVAVA